MPAPASWRLACLNSQLIEKLITVRIATIAPRIARSASVGVSTVWTISAAIRNSRTEQEIIPEVILWASAACPGVPQAFTEIDGVVGFVRAGEESLSRQSLQSQY